MYVSIWDKVKEDWLQITTVRYIVQLDQEYFKIDDIKYPTERYELNFIHND